MHDDAHNSRRVILLGGGGHAAVVAEAARAAGWDVVGFGDDNARELIADITHLGSIDQAIDHARSESLLLHAAVGDGNVRRKWLEHANGIEFAMIVHPGAVVSPSAIMREGVFVSAGAIINGRAQIGPCAIVNTAAVVEHDCRVGASVHVAPRAVLAGGAQVGEDALIGTGAIVLPGRIVGRGATVGAGAVVVDDVPDGMTVVGVPARAIGVPSG